MATFCHGFWGRSVSSKGSITALACTSHTVHFPINSTNVLPIPGHQTAFLALSLHLLMPEFLTPLFSPASSPVVWFKLPSSLPKRSLIYFSSTKDYPWCKAFPSLPNNLLFLLLLDNVFPNLLHRISSLCSALHPFPVGVKSHWSCYLCKELIPTPLICVAPPLFSPFFPHFLHLLMDL